MLKVLLQAPRPIPPFNEPARDLRIQNKPLWLNHNFLDRQQGFIVTPNAEGEVEKTSLMSLAIGILTPKMQTFTDIREITETAVEMRRQDVTSVTSKGYLFRCH
jgi:hypothetical protein